tara:strand:+ start:76 stop:375 length:300 start_codon:yes stop_codon:yes gene_type:complete
MILDSKIITKHMFQNGLTCEFSIPVTVEFGLIEDSVDVVIMRQTTLSEFEEVKNIEPLWTDVIITLSPQVMKDVDMLHDAYSTARATIKSALKKGSVYL